jgi:hypothetical protein
VCVRVRTTQDGGVQRACAHRQIVDVSATALQQARILEPAVHLRKRPPAGETRNAANVLNHARAIFL